MLDDLSRLFAATCVNELALTGIAVLVDESVEDGAHRVEIDLYTAPQPTDAASSTAPTSGPFAGQARCFSLHSKYGCADATFAHLLDALASHTALTTAHTLSFNQGRCATCSQTAETALLAHLPNIRTLHLADAHIDPRRSHVMDYLSGIPHTLPSLERLWLTQRSEEHVLDQELLAASLLRRYFSRCSYLEEAGMEQSESEKKARLKVLRVDECVVVDAGDEPESTRETIVDAVETLEWAFSNSQANHDGDK